MDSVVGGSSADSIYGDSSATATLNPFDNIDGGAGTDTLHLSMSADYIGDSTIKNIEVFSLRSSAAGMDFDANALTGVTSFTSNGSVNTLNVKNIGSAATAIGLSNISTNAADLTATFADAALSATNDTVTVNLSSAGNTAANAPDVTIITTAATTNGAETLAVTATGTNNLGVLASQGSAAATVLKTLNVSGAGDLTVATALDFAGTTGGVLNASTMTGKLSVGFAAADTGLSVTGGEGNDTFAFTTGLDTGETVDGGAGTDTVSVTGTDTFTLADYNVTNVEIFDQQSAAGNTLSMVTGGVALSKVVLRENANASIAVSAIDLAAAVAVDLNQTSGVAAGETVTLGLKDASGTADALTVTMKGVSANANNTVASLTIANIETLNLVSSKTSSTAAALNTTTGDQNILTTLTAGTALTTINASGSDALTISVGADATKLTTLSASAMTADFSATLAEGDVSVTGGSGDDTFVFAATLNNKDVVVGGANTKADTEDTLTATVTSLTATTGALSISGVERINLTNAGTATIAATGIVGATEIGFLSGGTTTTVTGLAASGTAIGIGHKGTDEAGNKAYGTVSVALADATGTADSVTFNLNNVDTGNAGDVHTATLKTSGIETVNLAYSTTATALAGYTITSTNLAAATINITGSDADADNVVSLGTLGTTTTTVDASTFKGKLIVSAANGTAATALKANGLVANNITGSSLADTITIGAATNTLVQSVAGGAGSDTLNITLKNGNQDFTSISAVETINITVADSAAVAMTNVAGIEDAAATKLTITGGNTLSTFTNTADTIAATTTLATIDASGFKGNASLFFADDTLTTANSITGGSGNDTVDAIYSASSNVLKMSAVETLNISNGTGASTVDLTSVTGATTVVMKDVATGGVTLSGYDLAARLKLGVGVDGTAGTDVDNVGITVTAASATGAADTLNVTVQNINTATLTANGIETLNLKIAADTGAAQSLSIADTNATNKYVVNVTDGTTAQGFTIASLSAHATQVDASTFIGNLTLTAAARAGTTAMTITGGEGNDSLAMEVSTDVMTGGAGTADTLTITQNAILGGFSIDLSSTVDQVTTYNGSANAALQLGFESVDASGVTGVFGADITANSVGSSITGTSSNDVITGGAGVDTIVGNEGGDAMSGGASLDSFDIANAVTIGGSGDAGTISGYDTISDFAAGTGSVNSETLNLAGVAALAAAGVGVDGNDSTLTVGAAVVATHTIAADGEVTFDVIAADAVDSYAILAAAVQYLALNDIGTTGDAVFMTGQISGVNHTFIYTQSAASVGNTGGYDVVDLVGVLGTSIAVANATTAGLIFIA